jgi:hypothetical protein
MQQATVRLNSISLESAFQAAAVCPTYGVQNRQCAADNVGQRPIPAQKFPNVQADHRSERIEPGDFVDDLAGRKIAIPLFWFFFFRGEEKLTLSYHIFPRKKGFAEIIASRE